MHFLMVGDAGVSADAGSHVAGVFAVYGVPNVVSVPAFAGVDAGPIFTFAGIPSVSGFPAVAGIPSFACRWRPYGTYR
jgi:hypothetical protein